MITPSAQNPNSQSPHDMSQLSSLDLSASQPPSLRASPIKCQSHAPSVLCGVQLEIVQNNSRKQEESESNLLDSPIKDQNEHWQTHLKHEKSKPVDCIFCTHGKKSAQISKSSREIILQAELIELQIQCSTLVGIIHKLSKIYNIPLTDLHNTEADSSVSDSSLCFLQDQEPNCDKSSLKQSQTYLEEMKNFQCLQKLVQNVKNQLHQYQEKMNSIHSVAQAKINQLNSDIMLLQSQLHSQTSQIQILKRSNQEMVIKNEELLLQIQKISQQYLHNSIPIYHPGKPKCGKVNLDKINSKNLLQNLPFIRLITQKNSLAYEDELNVSVTQLYQNRSQSQQSFTMVQYQECVKEMQKMIEKLVKTLQGQRKLKARLIEQIERLFECIKHSESEIQMKNNTIYELEKEILFKESTSLKKSRSQQQEKLRKNGLAQQKDQYLGRKKNSKEKDYQVTIQAQKNGRFISNYSQYFKSGQGEGSRKKKARGDPTESQEGNLYILNRPRPSSNNVHNQYYA